jgi:LPXTG-motif cell wall-anchored protein
MPNKTIVAMACVTAIIITCVFNNLNGFIVAIGVGAISGLGGFALGKRKKQKGIVTQNPYRPGPKILRTRGTGGGWGLQHIPSRPDL